jgi:hypothetical protein
MNKTEIILYYGIETPFLTVSHKLKNTLIVLQDYHPIVQQRVFKEYFPEAERFLYFNCCKIPFNQDWITPNELKFAKKDQNWNCLILDLNRKVHREFLLKKATNLIEYQGVSGFFMDDLDVWGNTPQDQRALLLFLEELERIVPVDFKFIFNRGFPFWACQSQRIRAVMIEDVGYDSCQTLCTQDQNWLEQTLSIHVPLILHKRNNISVFFLEYVHENLKRDIKKNSLMKLFDEFNQQESIHFMRSNTRNLNQWPQKLQKPQYSNGSLENITPDQCQ